MSEARFEVSIQSVVLAIVKGPLAVVMVARIVGAVADDCKAGRLAVPSRRTADDVDDLDAGVGN
jgi:hypothetical protein